MKVAILDDYFDTLRRLPSFARLDGFAVSVWTDHVDDVGELAVRLADVEALVLFRERTRVTTELLNRLPKLRLIAMRGDYPNVDVDACTRHGIILSSNMGGGSSAHPTAELTWALILASMRQLPQQMASLQRGSWQMGVGRSVQGMTIGLYGYGRVAKVVARYAEAFGMNVQWWGSEEGRTRASRDQVVIASSRQAFFAESDIVSIHVRLRPSTRGVITSRDLAAMSPSSLFVNTSRAGIVEEGALLGALDLGQPGYAAFDVFDAEPMLDPGDPLVRHENVICTPHIGFVTEDELDRQFAGIYDQVMAYASGQPINVVNPLALTT